MAALTEKEGIFLEAVPRKGEGLLAFARRLCGDERLAPQVIESNGSASGALLAGFATGFRSTCCRTNGI